MVRLSKHFVTGLFLMLLGLPNLGTAKLGSNELAILKQQDFLFVRGYLAYQVTAPQKVATLKKLRFGEYFTEQRTWLDSQKIPEQMAKVAGEASVEDNAEVVAKTILASGHDLVVVSHSKGGLETLEALLRNPEARHRVKLWVALQSPFFGAPIADMVYGHGSTRMLARTLLEKCWGGSILSLIELQTSTRTQYMSEHWNEIKALTSQVKIVTVGSSITAKDARDGGVPALLPLNGLMSVVGAGPNDGLVEISSAWLPGAKAVVKKNMDHADAVMPFPGRRFDRLGLFQKLVLDGLSDVRDGQR